MTAGEHPQTAIVDRGVLQGDPQAQHALGDSVQERGVLVAGHRAADPWLLEDQHRLQEHRLRQARRRHQRRDRRRAGEGREHRIQVVQRVADLVDRLRLGLAQAALLVEGLRLEEEVDALGGVQEVVVGSPGLLVGGEDGPVGVGVEVLHQLRGPCAQRVARRVVEHALEREEPIGAKAREPFGGHHSHAAIVPRAGPPAKRHLRL